MHPNSSSSSSWCLLHGADELIGFHGCKTWDLPKSPASLIPHSFKRYHYGDCHYVDSSGELVLLTDGADKAYCFLGNPVSQQWFKIPPPPSDPTSDDSDVFGLVTRLDQDGVVLSFKVIRLANIQWKNNDHLLSVLLYSSETGIWTPKVVHCPHQFDNLFNINLNGTIWRLNNDDDTWQLLWEVGFPIMGNYAPVAMHPFDIAIVYLWSQKDYHWVSCNLRKKDYTFLLGDASHQNCFIDEAVCKKSVDEIWDPRSSDDEDFVDFRVCIWFCPFVIPRWLESVPRPPQAEMIDMTSLLSYATVSHEAKLKDIRDDEYFWMQVEQGLI
ncbi:unnamed protein product [Eruca vesicaria subsp. sativa]|uniref:F-box protein At3g26010-like beta-propeller domain-containing protein n=1 Tax=Eruca vesicaria subsp. sativa TaxID=29727 RepID=A0ABC8LQE0_ERUVS|nr:unnamed protein product [Eruca vesicaria subsp. sativa]